MDDQLQPHIKVTRVNEYCFLSGNPDRVHKIASHLDNAEQIADHRGLIAYNGYSKNTGITVLTTGMGSASTAIIIEEAIRAGGRIFIRIGSCGALQSDDGIGTIFIPFAAIRDEGVSSKILPIEFPAIATPDLLNTIYETASEMDIKYNTGLVWTSDIYYNSETGFHKKWLNYGANCIEMESSLIFSYGILNYNRIKVASILTADGNLTDGTNIYTGNINKNYNKFQSQVDKSIELAILTVKNFEKKRTG